MYFPRDRQASNFGVVGETVPEGFMGQLVYPFRAKRQETATAAMAIETA
jgi:hypothetical protein